MILKSQRIYLRPLQDPDAPSFLDNTKDQEEIRYMTGTKSSFTLEQIQQHMEIVRRMQLDTILLYV